MEKKEITVLEGKLFSEFNRLNLEKFSDSLPRYDLKFAKKSIRTHGSINFFRKTIRISLPLFEQKGWDAVLQTLLHEMTHAYIHEKGGQARHSKRFWSEFEKRGGKRDRVELIPKSGYVYACPTCNIEIVRMRKIKHPWRYSCVKCDKNYNPKHKLFLKRCKTQSSILEVD